MLENFLNIGNPSWTDMLQGIAAVISIPGAIIAFILLFKKDKDKQKQINSLVSASESLITMVTNQQNEISELKNIAEYLKEISLNDRNKVELLMLPIIDMYITSGELGYKYKIIIYNTNTNSNMKSFSVDNANCGVGVMKENLALNNGKYIFGYSFNPLKEDNIPLYYEFKITYITNHGIKYYQFLKVFSENYDGKVGISPGIIHTEQDYLKLINEEN
ncbi:hypothetical protein [Myroides odoratus]|uniref:Uncharacterized protein n=1 Tax=Myroides odoratus TaxID=256 RepID=A0A378RMQ5_MYROD|nr:hypothetical protein [Myroides odoratus]QQU04241.1 hypothetical protein I6I89_02855 [Myroides odoratus]STZ28343.1 Uncharacterised protein [Myroides odoratus]